MSAEEKEKFRMSLNQIDEEEQENNDANEVSP
jgi:hypothetical protein